ncbi:carboxylate-amine ligase [Klebsiella variicola]|nr:carboxylate-amine ligase [Klebsiella variicola]
MPLADFHRSDPFTLGIELELQVVNPPVTTSARMPRR